MRARRDRHLTSVDLCLGQNSFDELTGMLQAVGSMLNQGGSSHTREAKWV